MNKEEIIKSIMELPKIKTNNPISAMNGINVDDLMSAIDRLDKVPTYQDLLKENKKYKEVFDKLKDKFNFYKNTEWGLKSCEILKVFEDILKEVKYENK